MKLSHQLRNLPLTLGTFAILAWLGTSAQAQIQSNNTPQTYLNTQMETYNPWAEDLLARLESDQLDIARALQGVGPEAAVKLWEEAMRKVLLSSQHPETHHSLVYRIAGRSLELGESLKELAEADTAKCPQNDQQCFDRPFLSILSTYEHSYKMIQHYYHFDQKYYYPEMCRLDRRHSAQVAGPVSEAAQAMENQVGEYAFAQLKWFTQNFQVRTSEGIEAAYSHHTYYVMLSSILKGLIVDLGGEVNGDPSLFVTEYAKVVAQMQILSTKIDNQIVGNHVNGTETGAFWAFNIQLEYIKNSLNPAK